MAVCVKIPRLICLKDSSAATQWSVWREDNPFRRCCGERPASALHRFLEFNTQGELEFDLVCDRDLTGDGETVFRMRWEPPEILLECRECHGSGNYTGFLSIEPCQACEGRGAIKILC